MLHATLHEACSLLSFSTVEHAKHLFKEDPVMSNFLLIHKVTLLNKSDVERNGLSFSGNTDENMKLGIKYA